MCLVLYTVAMQERVGSLVPTNHAPELRSGVVPMLYYAPLTRGQAKSFLYSLYPDHGVSLADTIAYAILVELA